MTFFKKARDFAKRKYFEAIIFTAFFCFNLFQITLHFRDKYDMVIISDARGYFEYLPYVFVFHDVENIYYSYKLNNGKSFDKYPCGVAILESPFFLASRCIDNHSIDKTGSYGKPLALSVAVASSFYLSLSFVLLFSLYRKLFDRRVALITLIVLYLGTNLFYYSIFEPGMSHVYSLFCFSAFLFCLERLLKKTSAINIVSTTFFLALAIEVRPTNAIMAAMYLLYNTYTWKDFVSRFRFLAGNFKFISLSLITAVIVFMPQFIYWYKTTGSFIFYSYGVNDESFLFWKAPKIAQVIFGVQAGWLPYTPVMIFFFIGLFLIAKKKQFHAPAIIAVFILILYCCASWWKYNFACAFGYRSFVEYYTLFMIPVAYLISAVLKKPKSFLTISLFIFLVLFCYLNIKMSNGYATGWPYCDDNFNWKGYLQTLSHIFPWI